MSITYNITTNFGAKDSLPSNDPDKVVRGAEFSTEFEAIKAAFATAAPTASPTFTGTVNGVDADFSGTITADQVDATTLNVTGLLTGDVIGANSFVAGSDVTTPKLVVKDGDFSYTESFSGADVWRTAIDDIGGDYRRINERCREMIWRVGSVSLTERMRLTPDGNLGIGDTSPAYKLVIDEPSVQTVATFNSAAAACNMYFADGGSTDQFQSGIGSVGDNLRLIQGGLELVTLNDAKMGIGQPFPALKLHVKNTGTNVAMFESAGASCKVFMFDSGSTNNAQTWVSSAGNDMVVGAGGADRVWFKEDGDVGIGLSTPVTKLHVNTSAFGNPDTTGTTVTGVGMRVQQSSIVNDFGTRASGTMWLQPRASNNNATNYGLDLCPNGGVVTVGIQNGTPAVRFQVHDPGIDSRIRIQADGGDRLVTNQLVEFFGDTSRGGYVGNASGNLAIYSDAGAIINYTSNVIRYQISAAGQHFWNGATAFTAGYMGYMAVGGGGIAMTGSGSLYTAFLWQTTSGTAGTIFVNGLTTTYGSSSDYRLKKNVVDYGGGLSAIKALRPVEYEFIAEPDKVHKGFIAHEVAEVVPGAVIGEKDGEEMQSLDLAKLVPDLVSAVQELTARLEALENV